MSAADPASVKAVEAFLGCFQIEEIGDAVARRAAALRAARKGLTLADAFVLATAQLGGRILVTRNIKVVPASMPGIHAPYTPQRTQETMSGIIGLIENSQATAALV